MNYGRGDKDGGRKGGEAKQTGLNKVVDSVQLGRGSFGNNGSVPAARLEIDDKLLIDPKNLYLGSKIGEGAHGKVYEAKFQNQVVALKVINGGKTIEEETTIEVRFIREVNMMSRVQHKNLVKFIGACKDPIMVIASELLPGMSLKKYLLSFRPEKLDLHLAISFAIDIASAMECLHANGIIHRDLKPDNLLLTANQKNVKLVDFGLAREETVTEMMTAETGTYRWMAPEQERPPLPEDAPSDLSFIIKSCWVEDAKVRPSFSQIIRMLNTFLLTLPPPSPEPDASPKIAAGGGGGGGGGRRSQSTGSAHSGRKLSIFRQLFASKKAGNNTTR